MLQRQRDGILPRFPIWDDIKTFDGKDWRGIVDIVAGGFPCKGISFAGSGTGLDHEESGLWREQARIIGEIRPRFAFVENSPALTTRGGLRVIGDFTEMGYDCCWGIISASDAIWTYGTPCFDHERARIWIKATLRDADSGRHSELEAVTKHSDDKNRPRSSSERRGSPITGKTFATSQKASDDHSHRQQQPKRIIEEKRKRTGNGAACNETADTQGVSQREQANEVYAKSIRRDAWTIALRRRKQLGTETGWHSYWASEPDVDRMVNGLANGVDRIRAIGNGQVPAVVELAWEILSHEI